MQSYELSSPGSIEQQYEQAQQTLRQRRALSAQAGLIATAQRRRWGLARSGAWLVGNGMVQLGAYLLQLGRAEDTAYADGSTRSTSSLRMHRARSTITDE
jgi:hypothetical protein